MKLAILTSIKNIEIRFIKSPPIRHYITLFRYANIGTKAWFSKDDEK